VQRSIIHLQIKRLSCYLCSAEALKVPGKSFHGVYYYHVVVVCSN